MAIRGGALQFVLITLLAMATGAEATPVSAALGTVLEGKAFGDPSFTLYRWDRFPSILILDTVSFGFQDRMFSRLAFFLEKRGFRGELLSDGELQRMHGWNAHDYGSEGLASFFNAAKRTGFSLNDEELTLRDIALANGILRMTGDLYAPGAGGVISISRSSSAIERRLLLSHESFHGIFFASAEYRAFCFRLWDSLDLRAKAFFKKFLDELGYDTDYRYLVVNEFQAYLMQQSPRSAPEYFQRAMKRFGDVEAAVPVETILKASQRLRSFLQERFGILADITAGDSAMPFTRASGGSASEPSGYR